MFVEYLFEINPITLLLVMLSLTYLIKQRVLGLNKRLETKYEETQITYKNYAIVTPAEQASNSILVMSYNILASYFTKLEYFPYCPENYLHVKYRAPRIVNEIEKVNPDILCLQECDFDLFSEYYLPNLQELGYNCHYKASSSNKIVINVICYKRRIFGVDEELNIDLNEELVKKDEAFSKFKDAKVLSLNHHASKKKIVVVNTQLYWNPDFEFVKYGQMAKILMDLEKKYSSSVPVIIAGDLNSLPNSNVMKYIYRKSPDMNSINRGDISKNRKLIGELWEEKAHHLELRSAYDSYKLGSLMDQEQAEAANNHHPDFTTYTQEFIGTLDYIFYSTKHFQVSQVLNVPNHDPEIKSAKLPNKVYPSDHLKIAARFNFI